MMARRKLGKKGGQMSPLMLGLLVCGGLAGLMVILAFRPSASEGAVGYPPRSEEERRARHRMLFPNEPLPPRGSRRGNFQG